MRITTDPSRELSLLQGDVNRVFERFFGPEAAPTQRWIPALDIMEQDDSFVLHMDLPGMSEDDVTIEVEDRVLRVAGERRDERRSSGDGFRRLERGFGRFERVLTLPRGVDPDAVQANFERGVLEVQIPKPEQSRPRRVDIKAGGSKRDQIEGREVDRSDQDRSAKQQETGQRSEDREMSHA